MTISCDTSGCRAINLELTSALTGLITVDHIQDTEFKNNK